MPRQKILVVEDERSLVEVLSFNLEREGFDVVTAFDGQEGLRQAQFKLPDLVVLDLMLPHKPGLEVCRELRMGPRTRDIPIIMVTAKAEESRRAGRIRDRCRRLRDQAVQREDLDRADQERAPAAAAQG